MAIKKADPHMLVIAKDEDDAIQKVKNGWGDAWVFNKEEGTSVTTWLKDGPDKGYSIVRNDSTFNVTEIKFDDYDIHIKNPRKAKLDRIEKNTKRNI